MIYALLEFGTIWFWLATVIPFVLLIACVEYEKSTSALAILVTVAALFVAFGDKNIIPYIKNHPIQILEYAGGYIAAGVVWGFVKWYFFLLKARDKFTSFRDRWIATYGSINDEPRTTNPGLTNRQVFAREARAKDMMIPSANDNKGRIIFWMSYWPASALWTLINDPFTRFFKFLYNRIGSVFEMLSNAMFQDLRRDFDPK